MRSSCVALHLIQAAGTESPDPFRPGLTESNGRLAQAGCGWDASSVGVQEQDGWRMARSSDSCLGLDGGPLGSCGKGEFGSASPGGV